jgi:arginyl-tRNA synthetase
MRSTSAHLDFDIDLAREQSNDNPCYYVQYAHARVASVFRTARESGLDLSAAAAADPSRLTEAEELALIRRLAQFPEVVEGAALELEPHRLVFYLMELASEFHRYYNRTRILGDDRGLAAARLLLAANAQKTIRSGLGILGITAPETM